MPGQFWIAVWIPGEVSGKKTTDCQTGAWAIRLQSEADLNARSKKLVHIEKLDRTHRAAAMGLRLGDS